MIPTEIVPSVSRCALTPRQVRREFDTLVTSGAKIHVAGEAKDDPVTLLAKLHPRHRITLFGTRFYLTNVFQIPELRFYVGYFIPTPDAAKPKIYARIFYKDLSLSWRVASHFTVEQGELWIGKGDVTKTIEDGHEIVVSNESTTDLPLEMQTAMESLLAFGNSEPNGSQRTIDLVLRRAPRDRIKPYYDFVAPRIAAQTHQANRIHGNRSIAKFTRPNDPTSLVIQPGFEPDFEDGVIERSQSKSKMYGGTLRRFRILSTNRQVQYYFFSSKTHVWLLPPQATTTQLSTYGVRTIDVVADDDLFIPGWEYHHYEETPSGLELYSQIPAGFAGDVCPLDDAKADASPWLDKIPILVQFRQSLQ